MLTILKLLSPRADTNEAEMSVVSEAVVCPMCSGHGTDYSVIQARMVVCTLCQGRRWVPVDACLGCGRPAYRYWPPRQLPIIRYCGLEDCLKHLVRIHLPSKPAIVAAAEKMKAFARRDPVKEELERQRALGPAKGPCM